MLAVGRKSFPSGHIAATIVLYGLIAVFARQLGAPQWAQVLITLWAVVASLAVGWARMYRGMHHPIDVVAGGLLGLEVLYVFVGTTGPSGLRFARVSGSAAAAPR